MESKIQSVIIDLGIKELNHPNLPGKSLRLFFCLFDMGSVFSSNIFYSRSAEITKLVI